MESVSGPTQEKTWDFFKVLNVEIARSAQVIWPFLFREKSDAWSKTQYTSISGERGQLGEYYEMPYRDGHLGFETIHLQAPNRLVLKITFRPRDQSRELAGYDLFELRESGGSTTVTMHQAFALRVDASADFAALSADHEKFLEGIFQDLKKMVEAES
jgi:hypothetical protein